MEDSLFYFFFVAFLEDEGVVCGVSIKLIWLRQTTLFKIQFTSEWETFPTVPKISDQVR